MLSKGFPEKTFCLLVIALLFVELLTPFAYAAGEEEKKVESIIQYPTGFVGSEACTTNPITPQERQTLYDNTIGKPIEQLTDLPLETALQAAQTPVQNPLSPDAPLNPFLESSANPLDQKISLASLAALMGVEKKELVEKYVDDFDEEKDDVNEVADNTFVSLAQAQAIARDKGGTAKERVDDIISKYFGIGGSQTSALPTPSPEPYANLKIILPGSPGRELTYNQLAAAQALNSESCLLNGEIKGKVSYLALLNADLTYGIPNDETLSGQYVYAPSGKVEGDLVDPRSNQWLVGNTILSILSLNGGANILVPSFYEDWIAFTGVWTRADAIISVATSLAAKSAADNIAKIKTAKTELKNSLLSSQAAREEGEIKSLIANDIYGPIQKQGGGLLYSTKDGKKVIVKSVFDVDVVTDKIIKDVTEETTDSILKTTAKTTVTAEGKEITTTVVEQTFKSPVAGAEPVLDQVVVKSTYAIERGQAEQVVTETIREDGTKILTTITTETQTVDAAQVLKITPEAGGAGLDVPIARENSVDGVLKQQGLSPVRVPNTGYENEIAQGMKMEASWNRLKRQVLGRVSYNLMMGGGWLGPARLAYDIADRNLFSASGFNDNKYLKVFVNKAVAQKFKSGTDVFGIGGVQELIGEWTNSELTTPSKAFKVGSVFLGNFPQGGSEDRESKTIVSSSSGWQITTSWKGSSNAVNFEDVRSPGRESFTSLPLVTNEILPEAVVNSKLGGSAYNFLLTLGLPFLVARNVFGEAGTTLGLATALITAEYVLKIDQDYGAGTECDRQTVGDFKNLYRTALIGDYILIGLTTILPAVNFAAFWWKQLAFGARVVGDVSAWTNPFLAWQWYVGNKAQIYVSNCKDPQYKILSYQKIPDPTLRQNQTASEKATDLLQNFVDTAKGENKVTDELAKYTEILNLKTTLTNQEGFVSPSHLFAIHIEKSAWMVPKGLFDSLNESGCFLQENHPTSDGGVISISKGGLKKVNKDGSVAFDFNSFYWKLRAASILRSQELARMIIPNTVISAPLSEKTCGITPFISINAGGRGTVVGDCAGAVCLKSELRKLVTTANFNPSDLSQFIGTISSVDTSLGTTTFSGNSISFTRTSIGEQGIETRAPSLEYLASQSGLGKSTVGTSLVVLGNASVVLNGPAGDFTGMDVGELKTIIGDKGKIEYDPYAMQLYVFVYVLADGPAQGINSVTGRTGTITNPTAGGTPIDVINLDLKPKAEYDLDELIEALKQIQADKTPDGKTISPGGFQVLETPDKIVYLTPDGKLKIIDKKTGEVQTFDLQGSPRPGADGSIIFPTNKGDVTITPGVNDKGQPIINIAGPGGLSSEGTLEAAKGPGGIFTFNPSTGAITVYNGQDLPMDPRFSSQGLGFVGSNGGTVGIPAENPFSLPPAPGDEGSTKRTNLILPAWPEQPIWFALMFTLVLVGVIAVRTTRFE